MRMFELLGLIVPDRVLAYEMRNEIARYDANSLPQGFSTRASVAPSATATPAVV